MELLTQKTRAKKSITNRKAFSFLSGLTLLILAVKVTSENVPEEKRIRLQNLKSAASERVLTSSEEELLCKLLHEVDGLILSDEGCKRAGQYIYSSYLKSFAERIASEVDRENSRITPAKTRKGWRVYFPVSSRKKVLLRLMGSDSGKMNEFRNVETCYYRVSVDGRGAVDTAGNFTADSRKSHHPFKEENYEQLERLVETVIQNVKK